MHVTDLPLNPADLIARLSDQGLFDDASLRHALPGLPRHLPLLQALGQAELTDQQGQPWDESRFTRWYAQQRGWVFQRIDPLETDVAAVTQVMSLGFAQSHDILAVDVSPDEVLVSVVAAALARKAGLCFYPEVRMAITSESAFSICLSSVTGSAGICIFISLFILVNL